MLEECIRARCVKCRKWLKKKDLKDRSMADDIGMTGILYFEDHAQAIRAMETAGWFPRSESIGGDLCAKCKSELESQEEAGAEEGDSGEHGTNG